MSDRLPRPAVRDEFLDCLKGFAILTVVAGHTFQNATPDFDDYWPFKFIYAFHMPMFMFVAGMTAAFFYQRQVFERQVLDRQVTAQIDVSVFGHDLWKKAQRLLIPFFTWAVVTYVLNPSGDFVSYMVKVVQHPDNGLWFLPVLFQCSIGLTAAGLLIIAFRRHCPERWSISWDNRWTQASAFIVATFLVSMISLAIPSGLYFAWPYFPFVAAGLVYQIALSRGLPAILRPLPYIVFLALVPFWHRTHLSSLVAYVPWGSPRSINAIYSLIVATAGTLAFVDLAGIIYRRLPAFLERSLVFLGQRSLDVYAIHFHFLGTWPPIIAPTLYSLVVSTVLRLNSWTAWIFFGQRQSLLASAPWHAGRSPALRGGTPVAEAAPDRASLVGKVGVRTG